MPGMTHHYNSEIDQLLAYVAQQRYSIRLTAHGLSREQATATPTKSALSIAGLLKHVAYTERGWVDMATGAQRDDEPGYMEQFALADGESVDGILGLFDEVAAETERAARELGLGHRFANPKGVPWFPAEDDHWDVRWMLLHLVEEIARHAGHADMLREHIDGRTMADIIAEVEEWEMPDWATA